MDIVISVMVAMIKVTDEMKNMKQQPQSTSPHPNRNKQTFHCL